MLRTVVLSLLALSPMAGLSPRAAWAEAQGADYFVLCDWCVTEANFRYVAENNSAVGGPAGYFHVAIGNTQTGSIWNAHIEVQPNVGGGPEFGPDYPTPFVINALSVYEEGEEGLSQAKDALDTLMQDIDFYFDGSSLGVCMSSGVDSCAELSGLLLANPDINRAVQSEWRGIWKMIKRAFVDDVGVEVLVVFPDGSTSVWVCAPNAICVEVPNTATNPDGTPKDEDLSGYDDDDIPPGDGQLHPVDGMVIPGDTALGAFPAIRIGFDSPTCQLVSITEIGIASIEYVYVCE